MNCCDICLNVTVIHLQFVKICHFKPQMKMDVFRGRASGSLIDWHCLFKGWATNMAKKIKKIQFLAISFFWLYIFVGLYPMTYLSTGNWTCQREGKSFLQCFLIYNQLILLLFNSQNVHPRMWAKFNLLLQTFSKNRDNLWMKNSKREDVSM